MDTIVKVSNICKNIKRREVVLVTVMTGIVIFGVIVMSHMTHEHNPEDHVEQYWPWWALPKRVIAWMWLILAYPLLAGLVISEIKLYGHSSRKIWVMGAASMIHVLANIMLNFALFKWNEVFLATACALVMLASLTGIARAFERASHLTQMIVWLLVAWTAYTASIVAAISTDHSSEK